MTTRVLLAAAALMLVCVGCRTDPCAELSELVVERGWVKAGGQDLRGVADPLRCRRALFLLMKMDVPGRRDGK